MKRLLKNGFLIISVTLLLFSCGDKERDDLMPKLIGKWVPFLENGDTVATNDKIVFTIKSYSEANRSVSQYEYTEQYPMWKNENKCDVSLNGNILTLTCHPIDEYKMVDEFDLKSVTNDEMNAQYKHTYTTDGVASKISYGDYLFVKINTDYSDEIVWEGSMTSEQSKYDDGEHHRWEYKSDGSYVYYKKIGDVWKVVEDEFSHYIVDGNLLCTRWKENGFGQIEHREWWEIESIKDGVMKWVALRKNEDNTTYTATFQMKRVQ